MIFPKGIAGTVLDIDTDLSRLKEPNRVVHRPGNCECCRRSL